MIGMVSNRLVLPLALWYTGTESFLLFLSNMSCVAFGRHLKPFVLFILHAEKYCTLLAFSCVRLHHCCWHWDTLWVVWEEGSCLLVCFGCAYVLVCLVRGKWNWLTEPSQQNHLDLRDTVSAEWLHYRKHAYAHICVCPPGPCGEVECISLLCPGRRGCWWGSGWGGGGREVAVVRKCAQYSTRNLSGAAAMMEATNVINPHSPYLYLSPPLSLSLSHTDKQQNSQRVFRPHARNMYLP